VFWVTIPVMLSMSFFSQKIFFTLFGGKMTPDQISEASMILIACLSGLFFFSINKILLNLYYALHVTWLPALIAAVGTILNVFLNWIFMSYWQATGLALATSISSGLFQTILFVWFLCRYYNFRFYGARLFDFVWRYTVQLAAVSTLFYGLFLLTEYALRFLPLTLSRFFVSGLGFWFWAAPLCGICLLILFYTRKICKVKLYFLGDN
jgi:peptidoglycan biosynthesis protein MviN/MurJ (putative lipid II flippase)